MNISEIENALEDPKAALSREEQNQRLLEVLESAGKGMPQGSVDLPLSIDSGEEIPGTPTTTTTGLGSVLAATPGIAFAPVIHKESLNGSGLDFVMDSPLHNISRSQTPPVENMAKKINERKYTVLSEYGEYSFIKITVLNVNSENAKKFESLEGSSMNQSIIG